MASGRAIFQAAVDGPLQTVPYDAQWTLSLGLLGMNLQTSFGSGDNTLTIPSGTKVILIKPPTTNAATMKVGASSVSANGLTLQSAMPTVLTWGSGAAIVNCSSSVNPVDILYFG